MGVVLNRKCTYDVHSSCDLYLEQREDRVHSALTKSDQAGSRSNTAYSSLQSDGLGLVIEEANGHVDLVLYYN